MSQWKSVPDFSNIKYARYIVPNFASNTVCIELNEAKVVVISPGKSLIDSFAEMYPGFDEVLGEGLEIVMPNAYHFLGVASWLERFPKAKLYASEQAKPLLEGKGVRNINVISDGDSLFDSDCQWFAPPGHRGGDLWLSVREQGKVCWVTCDSFLNYPRMSNQPIARFTQKIMGAAPGLKLSRVIKYLLLTNRKSFKKWCLDMIHQERPVALLPSHGDPMLSTELADELERLVLSRL
ncbi:hypothetical protein A3715_14340 [Oleiphilus sp. HI0009]|uniref:hypothetical protein n=3 Tax=Oleiphilus TaxID=141450 RepID=UPI0007C2A22B|nr:MULTISPECIES: hypothetical protein [unclassified Oleiphilus]KZX75568.1 hypothetical protein A3715_14340 [Oleiphilus sp. HI0009]KZY68843.1 hypothetical protein A3739_10190 [Oleiphilus sp. HI0067]KZY69428.1 hypothetical protein A3738_04310 [Oleiphilus sp. HI0066]